MKLILFHGRNKPDADLDDWGYEFPVISGVKSICGTYRSMLVVDFHSSVEAIEASMRTGWELLDATTLEIVTSGDFIVAAGSYFGDWKLVEDGDPVDLNASRDVASSAALDGRYGVHQYTLCDGWVNTWLEDDGPLRFADTEEAQVEIDDFMKDIATQIASGERAADDGYDSSDFCIYDRLTGEYIISNETDSPALACLKSSLAIYERKK